MILERFILNKVNLLARLQWRQAFASPDVNFTRQLRLASSAPPDFWRRKSSYPWFLPVQTRWKDNDQYLHMNNAVYHAIFDSVINVYLIRNLGLDVTSTTTSRGFMVTNSCTFSGSCAYPHVYMAGLAVSKLGNSSVRYRLGLFPLLSPSQPFPCDPVQGHRAQDQVLSGVSSPALVTGDSTHVFVDPATQKATAISQPWRSGLEELLVQEQGE